MYYGPEFVAEAVRDWIKSVGARTPFIKPGSPWENGYCESFNARFRDELLDRYIFIQPAGGADFDRTMAQTLQKDSCLLNLGTISP